MAIGMAIGMAKAMAIEITAMAEVAAAVVSGVRQC